MQIADSQEGLSDAGGILPASKPALSQGGKPIDMSSITDPNKMPVKALDDEGREILDRDGNPLWRPKDLPPSLFVDKGLAAAEALRNAGPDAGAVALDPMILDHIQMAQGGPLDAQRVNGVVVRQYVDYATVAIGLYGASSGASLEDTLATEDLYASRHSKYLGQEMDQTYTHLPKRNVYNRTLGYDLYNSTRVGPSR